MNASHCNILASRGPKSRAVDGGGDCEVPKVDVVAWISLGARYVDGSGRLCRRGVGPPGEVDERDIRHLYTSSAALLT